VGGVCGACVLVAVVVDLTVTGLCAGLVGHILVMAVDEVKESVTLGAAVVHAQARVGGNDGLDLLVNQVTEGVMVLGQGHSEAGEEDDGDLHGGR